MFLLVVGSKCHSQIINNGIPKSRITTNLKLKKIPFTNFKIVKTKTETLPPVNSSDCPGAMVHCTVTREDLESPIFGTSIFTIPNDLFVGNLFDVEVYKNSGVMTPKLLGTRKKITLSASTHSAGGTNPEEIEPSQSKFMSFLTRARNELDILLGDTKPIESAEYNFESIMSKEHLKATLGANYSDPQNYFDFQSSISSGSQKQYVVLKFIERSFDITMDDPINGLLESTATIPSSYGFVSNITYGRFALLIFETSRQDFDLKATLEAGLNGGVAIGGANASAEIENVQSNIKVRLILQGFNADSKYSNLLSSSAIMDNSIITKINEIIGGTLGKRTAAIPIMITAKKATLENNSYPEIIQTISFKNVPVNKSCETKYPESAKTYKYEVSFNKIYSTTAGWGGAEQLYGELRCWKSTAKKTGDNDKKHFALAALTKPNEIEIEKNKVYNLNSLMKNLKSQIITFTKPDCITEKEFLEKSYISMSAYLKIDRNPFKDERFILSSRHKDHYLNTITNTIDPYENFGNNCNSANNGIICAITPDGQNFQISYTIKKISN